MKGQDSGNSISCQRREVLVQGEPVSYVLQRKNVKNINLRVSAKEGIRVSANSRIPADYIDEFVIRKGSFIFRAKERVSEKEARKEQPLQFITGEETAYLGGKITLDIQEAEKEQALLEEDRLTLFVRDVKDTKRAGQLYEKWKKEKSREIFTEYCRKIYPMFEKEISFPQIKVRSMTSRWGSCHPVKGIITLNSRMLAAPKECIEYVVLHEFSHFIYPNHSKAFYRYIEERMPDYRERKRRLNQVEI